MTCEEPECLAPEVVDFARCLQQSFAAHQSGDLATAERGYYEVLQQVPNHPDALHLLGLICKARGDLKTAKTLVARAIDVRPEMPAQSYNLGNILSAMGDGAGAEKAYRATLALKPDYVDAWYALGNLLRERDDLVGAIEAFRQAITFKPAYYEARHNLANVLRENGDAEGAVLELRQVLAQVPDLAEAHYNLALALFTLGRYREGGAHYEWRWKSKGFSAPARNFAQPAWDGSPLPHGTLLVYAEQGLGDTLQFIRYLRLVRPKVGQLVVEVPQQLICLLKPFEDLACFVAQGSPLPPFDRQVALLSLPHLTGEVVPGFSYLQAEPERVARWAERLSGKPGLKVGLNWQGNPQAKIDKGRSLPLAQLASLFDVPNVRFISLQKNAGVEQLVDFPEVETLGAAYDSGADAFLDAAAVMAQLDLFITSDTALAHLAGALGVQTALLLKQVPDWRWGLRGEKCLWYPSLTLYRQSVAGVWETPISALEQTVRALVAQKEVEG